MTNALLVVPLIQWARVALNTPTPKKDNLSGQNQVKNGGLISFKTLADPATKPFN
jgi:hypothetical protein